MPKTTLSLFLATISSLTLAANDITFSGDITYDLSAISGSQVDDEASRVLVNLNSEVNLSPYLGKDAVLNVGVSAQRGSPVRNMADAQGFDNMDSRDFEEFFEVVLQLKPFENSILKIGQQDGNTDFAAPDNAGEFVNSSMGFSPTIALPSYPDPTLSMSYAHQINQNLVLKAGIFESANSLHTFDDTFSILQADYNLNSRTNIKVGYWDDTALNTSDVYFIVDHRLSDSIFSFLQYGNADANIIGLDSHFSIGLQKENLLSNSDLAGIAYTQVDDGNNNTEGVVEMFYKHDLTNWLSLKEDIQYISSPGFSNLIDDTFAFTLRLNASF